MDQLVKTICCVERVAASLPVRRSPGSNCLMGLRLSTLSSARGRGNRDVADVRASFDAAAEHLEQARHPPYDRGGVEAMPHRSTRCIRSARLALVGSACRPVITKSWRTLNRQP